VRVMSLTTGVHMVGGQGGVRRRGRHTIPSDSSVRRERRHWRWWLLRRCWDRIGRSYTGRIGRCLGDRISHRLGDRIGRRPSSTRGGGVGGVSPSRAVTASTIRTAADTAADGAGISGTPEGTAVVATAAAGADIGDDAAAAGARKEGNAVGAALAGGKSAENGRADMGGGCGGAKPTGSPWRDEAAVTAAAAATTGKVSVTKGRTACVEGKKEGEKDISRIEHLGRWVYGGERKGGAGKGSCETLRRGRDGHRGCPDEMHEQSRSGSIKGTLSTFRPDMAGRPA